MPWIKFKGRFKHRPTKQTIQIFKPGQVLFATRALASEAMRAGVAVLTDRPVPPLKDEPTSSE